MPKISELKVATFEYTVKGFGVLRITTHNSTPVDIKFLPEAQKEDNRFLTTDFNFLRELNVALFDCINEMSGFQAQKDEARKELAEQKNELRQP